MGPKDLPKWVKNGVEIRVKSTVDLRATGVSANGGERGDSVAWPGEVATIVRIEGNGWWSWSIQFLRGRTASFHKAEDLNDYVRVPAKKGETP